LASSRSPRQYHAASDQPPGKTCSSCFGYTRSSPAMRRRMILLLRSLTQKSRLRGCEPIHFGIAEEGTRMTSAGYMISSFDCIAEVVGPEQQQDRIRWSVTLPRVLSGGLGTRFIPAPRPWPRRRAAPRRASDCAPPQTTTTPPALCHVPAAAG